MFFHRKNRRVSDEAVYAKASDFADIFVCDMNRLFLLGLLLTGNVPDAERCLVVAFDFCIDGAVVRRQWAPSWARRSVIKSAIRIMSPKLADNCNFSRGGHEKEIRLDMEHLLDEVCNLPIFDRFVFVISILESFPCCECSVLLNSTHGMFLARGLGQWGNWLGAMRLGGQHARLGRAANRVLRTLVQLDQSRSNLVFADAAAAEEYGDERIRGVICGNNPVLQPFGYFRSACEFLQRSFR
jgi:hypothetical protein